MLWVTKPQIQANTGHGSWGWLLSFSNCLLRNYGTMGKNVHKRLLTFFISNKNLKIFKENLFS